MSLNKQRIIIFGFSGSGKSTIADMIAKKYGLRVIHPSGILRTLLQHKKIKKTEAGKGFWESQAGVKLFKKRLKEKEPMDIVADKILLKELSKGNLVMDSWNMPWLSDKGLKIYLKTSLSIRAQRVAKRSGLVYKKALAIVKMKDEETRKLFKRVYGFDIKKDFNIFHKIISTDKLNPGQVLKVVEDFLSQQN